MDQHSFEQQIVAVALLAGLLLGCGAPQLTATPRPPTPTAVPTEAPTAVPTLASLPSGGLVYGDPEGRFSLPLVGE